MLLVRHGETAWNAQHRWQGQRDVPLNARGRLQSRLTCARLADLELAAVYSSDLGRCLEGARRLALGHGLAVRATSALRERSYGALEGLTTEEAIATDAPWVKQWQRDRVGTAPPGGETTCELQQRVVDCFRSIRARHPAQSLALVVHGGPIKALLYHLLGTPLEHWGATSVANGSITTLRVSSAGHLVLTGFNDTSHLAELGHG